MKGNMEEERYSETRKERKQGQFIRQKTVEQTKTKTNRQGLRMKQKEQENQASGKTRAYRNHH